jgi:16S rRNA (cytosine1402-N4)-methyltransferase
MVQPNQNSSDSHNPSDPTSAEEHRPYHLPVMVDEVVAGLEPARDGWIVDATLGGGGHSRALLDRFPHARLIGVDRDPDALLQAPESERLSAVRGNYRDIASILSDGAFPDRVDGILFDLGVSSHQLDTAERGFSYRYAGPLDMRMGPDAGRTAGELVNEASVDELAGIFRRYGEERFAKRIAEAIVDQRPFADTLALATCISDAVPAATRRKKHPARRVFQAIRIEVNDELAGISEALEGAIEHLTVGGRIVVMAYHSLEDRIVKRLFVDRSQSCVCPPDIPVCVCGADPDVRVITRKPIKASEAEIAENPRARSAVLRIAEVAR